MNPELLKQFHDNHAMRDEVKKFFEMTLKERALTELMNSHDATYLAKSLKAVDDMFISMAEVFEPKKKPVITSTR